VLEPRGGVTTVVFLPAARRILSQLNLILSESTKTVYLGRKQMPHTDLRGVILV